MANLVDQGKESLKKLKEDVPSDDDIAGATIAIKVNPAFLTPPKTYV